MIFYEQNHTQLRRKYLQPYSIASSVAARSKATACGCSLAGIAGSNSATGMDVCVVTK